MEQDEGRDVEPAADAARQIEDLARRVRGRVNGLESRRDLERIISLAREIEDGSASS